MLLVICLDFLHFCIFFLFRFYIFCARTRWCALLASSRIHSSSDHSGGGSHAAGALLRFLDFLHLCMTFLDLAEGDKLAVVVVEL